MSDLDLVMLSPPTGPHIACTPGALASLFDGQTNPDPMRLAVVASKAQIAFADPTANMRVIEGLGTPVVAYARRSEHDSRVVRLITLGTIGEAPSAEWTRRVERSPDEAALHRAEAERAARATEMQRARERRAAGVERITNDWDLVFALARNLRLVDPDGNRLPEPKVK